MTVAILTISFERDVDKNDIDSIKKSFLLSNSPALEEYFGVGEWNTWKESKLEFKKGQY